MGKEREWQVVFHPEFDEWFLKQPTGLQDETQVWLTLLRRVGPQLGRPHVDTVETSAFRNMKELRIQYKGKPWRMLFAFDPLRNAVMLVGGMKAGQKRWYKVHVPIADKRFAQYTSELKKPEEE
jgi:hypothetical protein